MAALIDIQQGSQEWHNLRSNKIGASDAPVIMQCSPWKTPFQLFEEKIGLKKNTSSKAMQRGLDLEDKARKEFENITGYHVSAKVFIKDWRLASLDGMTNSGEVMVEIKCPGSLDHRLASTGKIPDHYYPQLQHQMEVTGLDMAYYFSFDGEKGILLEVERNETYIHNLLIEEEKFYTCLNQMIAPPLTERDYVLQSSEAWNSLASDWLSLHHQMKQLESRQEVIRNSIILLSDKSNSKGSGIRVNRQIRKGNIDYSAIDVLKTVNLDIYRKAPIECWSISQD